MDLKIKDVAELLNVSETTIRRWLAEGKIPAYRLHHQYRFSRIEIENWVMSCRLKRSTGNFLPVEEDQIYPHMDDPDEQEPQPLPIKQMGIQQFSLFRAIHKGGVITQVASQTKEGIIRETMQVIAKDLTLDAEVLSELLLDREKLMPTCLSNGVAVPHTRDFVLKAPFDVITVLIPPYPVDWGSLDGTPVHTIFFLFASDDKRHLHLLAKLAHLSSNEEALSLLHSRPSKKKLLSFIKNWEAKIG